MDRTKPLFSVKYKVRFYDTDLSRTVFFANYAKWLDSIAAVEHSEQDGISWRELIEQNIDTAIVHTSFDYKAPLFLDDVVEIQVTAVEFGKTSMKLSGAFYRDDTLIAQGHIVYVFVNHTTREPIPVPEVIKKAKSG